MDGDEQVGVLVIHVDTWRWTAGPFWRRRRGGPEELPEWRLLYGAPEEHPHLDEWVISAADIDKELADWAAGVLRLRGHRYGLAWLGAEEADAARRDVGWAVD